MSLVDRARNIIVHPRQEWEVIDTEPTTVARLYSGYIVPLSAIPPVAMFIGWSLIGVGSVFGGAYRVPIGAALRSAVVSYILGLIGIYVFALIIDALAPTFGGTKNRVQALKVAAYSATAAWIAGIFALLPALGWLRILGLYSIYLLYTGLPVLMKSPADRSIGYTAVVIVVGIVIAIIVSAIAVRTVGYPGMTAGY